MERERKSSGHGGMSEGFRQQLGKTKSKVSMPDQGAVEIHKSVKAFSQMIAHEVVAVGTLVVRMVLRWNFPSLRRP
jgi:hypothetical protein